MSDARRTHRTDGQPEVGVARVSLINVPGSPIETRRQLMVKVSWMLLWMVYLAYPVNDLLHGGHDVLGQVLGWVSLAVFLVGYVLLVVYRSMTGMRPRECRAIVAMMVTLAISTSLTLGESFLTLFTYASVCVAVIVPVRYALGSVLGMAALTAATGLVGGAGSDTIATLTLTSFLSGAAMTGMQRLVATMKELREARAAVAHLAASEERLRLARDLHDLLGHSLSLITLKSELAGRFMDAGKDEAARAQVADIEQVARQSLIDVREAVTGFRRPTLPVELAAARTALAAAQIRLEAAPELVDTWPSLANEEAGALAWALREAVTNIVRHGEGAAVCTVRADESWEPSGERYAVLEITDDGRGPGKSQPGNGLSGLEERLALVGGRLETGPGARGRGFRLRASVPLRTVSAPAVNPL
ncbi:sensor histidine kinase [Kitasatospora sp. SUK 42]|uniref:sensor histidine kinase n=1 Tax=Kitasatospora sp. SUK 42 TaxID=1588882 RepID=UPI0018CB72C0|nr:histidine kinase [Kitasatospora sp. SUK 42]MBV2152173.1 sensor histidine kinase [Kitasatospora sp. SUK 42]